MEVHSIVSGGGELATRDQISILIVLISPVMGRVVRAIGRVLRVPGSAPVIVAISVIELIIATTGHVVDNSASVDSNAVGAASLNHASELSSGATTSIQVVGDGLIVPVPGVDLPGLGPFVGEDSLVSGEYFDAHPSHLAESLALSLDFGVGPAEHFNDTTLLAAVVRIRLVNRGVLPDEILLFNRDSVFFTLTIGSFHGQGESLVEAGVSTEDSLGRVASVVPVVLSLDDRAVGAASGLNLCSLTVLAVGQVVETDNAAHTLVSFLVVR